MRNMFGQVVFKTGVVTLFVFFTAFSYGAALFGFIAPRTMANFCDVLGADNAAAMYHERIYNSDKTNENLYVMVDRYIATRNKSKIIKHSPKLINEKEFIQRINDSEETRARNKEEYLLLCNEGNRVKYMYTDALLKTQKSARAKTEYMEWLQESVDIAAPLHTFYAFLLSGCVDQQLIDASRVYFEEFVDRYEGGRGTGFADIGNARIMALDYIVVFGAYFLGTDTPDWANYFLEYQSVSFVRV